MKRLTALFVALVLLLWGCGPQGAPPPESPVSPASPSSQETPEPAPAEPSSQPEAAPADPEEDALVQEMILAYGGERMPREDGTSRLVRKVDSLFDLRYSWNRPEEIPASWYYTWFLSAAQTEDPSAREHYTSPVLEARGVDSWFIPQEVYEERIAAYFNVPLRLLRLGREYDPELGGYWSDAPKGLPTGRKGLSYSYTREGGIFTIQIDLDHPQDSPLARQFLLTVRLEEDGSWKYLNCQCQPGEVPIDYPTREGADVLPLTGEQWALIDRAEELVRIFQLSIDSMENYYTTVEYGSPIQIDGTDGWCLYFGDKYKNYEDLRAQMCETLTPEFFDRLNQSGTFAGYEGKLYVRGGSRDGNRAYLSRQDRFSVQEAGDQLVVTRHAYYCDPEEAEDASPRAVEVRALPILLKNTPEGWRVDFLTLPY